MKKVLTTVLSLALVACLSIAGTVAYLQSEDSDVNVMTLGNVEIAQHEYERVVDENGEFTTIDVDGITSYELQEFTQAKPLYPSAVVPNGTGWGWDPTPIRMAQVGSYGGMSTFVANSNAQDKLVTVENTGASDAYVRTLVAIEVGEADASLIRTNSHLNAWTRTNIGEITIDNNKYFLQEYVYAGALLSNGTWRHENGIVPAGDTTYPNLAQVCLDSKATNEDMAALDGNKNGTFEVLVLSQAVQTKGFNDAKTALDTAFGTITTENHPWIDGIEMPKLVSTEEALVEGGSIVLENDITLEEPSTVITSSADINLNGHTIKATNRTTNDGNSKEAVSAVVVSGENTEIVFDGNGTIDNSNEEGGYAITITDGAKVVIKDGNYISWHDAIYVHNGELIIEGGFFQALNDTDAEADYIHPQYPDNPASFTAEVINCNKDAYINAKQGTNYSGGIVANVTIKGGTFVNEDPSNIFEGWFINDSYVAEGYTVISEAQTNGDIWYTVVPE